MQSAIADRNVSAEVSSQQTRALLACGVIAGPLFAVVSLLQVFTRPGFDVRRHALSVLENGELLRFA
jgi:hypothetical protein